MPVTTVSRHTTAIPAYFAAQPAAAARLRPATRHLHFISPVFWSPLKNISRQIVF